uniref:Reverse transcriptase domain-containing protein n=1 Tax=Tanacetum cinerariifolium TaxID=118510 RepID=A0A699K979_TANCI|nr:hypothetical protein [Tanacetum cinerariifolium]
MNEPELIFPSVEVGSPKPPPLESSNSETEMTAEGDHVQRVAREGTRVENIKLKRELEAAEISNTLLRMGRERTQREIYRLRAWTYEFYEEMTMPPRRLKRRAVERMVQKQVAEAITGYKRNKTNPENAEGSGPANAGGVVAPDVHGCSYKIFGNCQPHSFNGPEGVVGLTRWFEKIEQVFKISKCAEERSSLMHALLKVELRPGGMGMCTLWGSLMQIKSLGPM